MVKRNSAPLPATGRLVGYARVSTREQTLDHQIAALKAAGVHEDNLHVETVSGVYSKRPKRDLALIDCRPGDTFVVWRVDRLSRKIIEIFQIVEELKARGVGFRSLMEPFDFSTAMGQLGFGIAAVMAAHERNVTIERTKSGMKAAYARGLRPGREPKLNPKQEAQAEKLLARGWTPREVAEKYGVSRQAIYTRWKSEDVARLRGEIEDE